MSGSRFGEVERLPLMGAALCTGCSGRSVESIQIYKRKRNIFNGKYFLVLYRIIVN